jgi:5-methylcytosine-specific restriction endonuclease McrA
MARKPGLSGRPWNRIRNAVLATSTTCWICGKPGADTVDHLTPQSRGGAPYDPRNLAPAHRSCNSKRGASLFMPSRKW